MLKANLHLHTNDDPIDNTPYTTYQAIDYAKKLDFNILAITCHEKFAFKKEYGDYARQKGILLIAGIEASIEGKDVLILNCDKKAENMNTFKELKNYKEGNPQCFIVAPHPFVLSRRSLGKRLVENIALFDAIELTIFSNKILNFNKKAEKIARKYHKPLIATSDTHFLKYFKKGYALINADEMTEKSLFDAARKGRIENKVTPAGFLIMLEFKIKNIIQFISFLSNPQS